MTESELKIRDAHVNFGQLFDVLVKNHTHVADDKIQKLNH